jgi:hypothetical protein
MIKGNVLGKSSVKLYLTRLEDKKDTREYESREYKNSFTKHSRFDNIDK